MQINYRGDKITVTPAIKDYVAEKLSRLDRYFENAEGITAYVLIKVKYKLHKTFDFRQKCYLSKDKT